MNERKKNIMLVNNQISGWMSRVAQKLAEQTDDLEGLEEMQGKMTMVEQYRYIA